MELKIGSMVRFKDTANINWSVKFGDYGIIKKWGKFRHIATVFFPQTQSTHSFHMDWLVPTRARQKKMFGNYPLTTSNG